MFVLLIQQVSRLPLALEKSSDSMGPLPDYDVELILVPRVVVASPEIWPMPGGMLPNQARSVFAAGVQFYHKYLIQL